MYPGPVTFPSSCLCFSFLLLPFLLSPPTPTLPSSFLLSPSSHFPPSSLTSLIPSFFPRTVVKGLHSQTLSYIWGRGADQPLDIPHHREERTIMESPATSLFLAQSLQLGICSPRISAVTGTGSLVLILWKDKDVP